MCVPVLFEVAHERGAEMAVGLLAAERGHVLPEDVERLCPDPQRAPVPGGVHEPRARQRLDAPGDRRVHLVGRLDHLVAEQVAVRRPRLELEAGEDRLPRQPVSHRPRQPQVGRAGEDPLLACREVEPRTARRDHVVDRVQDLAGAADREGLDGGHPELLGRLLRLSGPVLLRAQPAEELVHVAEVARDEEQVVDAAVVQVREVEACAEDPPAGVARVADDRAADDADLHLGVEQRQVDGDLGGRERVAVLRVQVAVVADLEIRRLSAALEIRPAEIGDAGRTELVETRERLLGRAQHRPDEVRAAARRGEHEREEEALRDLDALLVGAGSGSLGCHLRPRRHEPREALGCRVDEIFVADRPTQVVGQRGVDRVDVGAQEPRACGVERPLESAAASASASFRSRRAGRRPSSSSPRTRCAQVAALAASKSVAVAGSLARHASTSADGRPAASRTASGSGIGEHELRLRARRS